MPPRSSGASRRPGSAFRPSITTSRKSGFSFAIRRTYWSRYHAELHRGLAGRHHDLVRAVCGDYEPVPARVVGLGVELVRAERVRSVVDLGDRPFPSRRSAGRTHRPASRSGRRRPRASTPRPSWRRMRTSRGRSSSRSARRRHTAAGTGLLRGVGGVVLLIVEDDGAGAEYRRRFPSYPRARRTVNSVYRSMPDEQGRAGGSSRASPGSERRGWWRTRAMSNVSPVGRRRNRPLVSGVLTFRPNAVAPPSAGVHRWENGIGPAASVVIVSR